MAGAVLADVDVDESAFIDTAAAALHFGEDCGPLSLQRLSLARCEGGTRSSIRQGHSLHARGRVRLFHLASSLPRFLSLAHSVAIFCHVQTAGHRAGGCSPLAHLGVRIG